MKKFLAFVFTCLSVSCPATYYSQHEQDKFIWENYFEGSATGFFVDIGAYDGVTISNSYFLESEKGWTGICVEPLPDIFELLKKNRTCHCIQGCVSDKAGEAKFLALSGTMDMLSGLMDKYHPRHIKKIGKQRSGSWLMDPAPVINVKCYTLNDLLDQHGIKHVSFLSIDTEGGEYEIIASIDFSRFKIDVITVEDNYNDSRFHTFFEENGYDFVKHLGCDLLFVKKEFKNINYE